MNLLNSNKKYGLIIPKKETKSNLLKPSAFNNDDSDDDKDKFSHKPSNYNQTSKKNAFIKKQAQLNIEKALLEDPNCFEYDKVYEEDHQKKEQLKQSSNSQESVKPKYINHLMKAAEKRKREYERRVERTVQKERDKEKGMYEDKEAFVTSAYKEKMKRIKEEEELERRQQALDEMESSKNDKDFVGFYRNILNQKTGDEKSNNNSTGDRIKMNKKETEDDIHIPSCSSKSCDGYDKHSSTSSQSKTHSQKSHENKKLSPSYDDDADDDSIISSSSDDDDADDDSIISSSSSSDEDDDENKISKKVPKLVKEDESKDEPIKKSQDDNSGKTNVKEAELNVKHDKRTVGDALNDAKARYLARKKAATNIPTVINE